MNREIKFRAWVFDKMKQLDVLAIGEVSWSCGDGFGVSMAYQPDFKVMQYTGLKDKNDKEIYEGDIVQYRHIDNVPYRKAQIRYVDLHKSIEIHTFDGYLYHIKNNRLEFDLEASEVIGNIYENPELLSQDKDE